MKTLGRSDAWRWDKEFGALETWNLGQGGVKSKRKSTKLSAVTASGGRNLDGYIIENVARDSRAAE